MNLSNSLFLLFTLVGSSLHQSEAMGPRPGGGGGGGGGGAKVDGCTLQANCLTFTSTPVNTTLCATGDCEFEICATISGVAGDSTCSKGEIGDQWSHTCVKDDEVCLDDLAAGFGPRGPPQELVDVPVGNVQCQTVRGGGTVEFLYKDGSTCSDSVNVFGDLSFVAGDPSCAPRVAGTDSCTGNGVGVECVWEITAPECDTLIPTTSPSVISPTNPSGGPDPTPTPPVPTPAPSCDCRQGNPNQCSNCGAHGDPHFKTWTGDKYDFHGECDLVLLQNPAFNAGLGMHVHIRTKAWGRYSSIETAAVRIGEDTLEVQADGDETHHWINGVAQAEFPSTLSGFPIEYTEVGKGTKKQRFYTITLDGDEKIVVNTIKKLVQVLFKNATKGSFASSGGLMGDYETGGRVARDGQTVIKKWDPFGQEWQVRSSDPSLFQIADGPQHPDKCVMPLVTSKATKQRRLSESGVGEAEAAKACANVALDERDECVFDVLATGDIEMVYIYDTATAGVH